MAGEWEAAHEEALLALLKGVKAHVEASTSAPAVASMAARAAAAKDLAEAHAWLRAAAQSH